MTDDTLGDGLPPDRVALVLRAREAMMALTEAERSMVLEYFCRHCHRFLGPGDVCHCWNDD